MVHLALLAGALAAVAPAWAVPEPRGERVQRQTRPVAYPLTLRDNADHTKRAGTTSGPVIVSNTWRNKMYTIPIEVGTPPQIVSAMLRLDFSDVVIAPGCDEQNCAVVTLTKNSTLDAFSPGASSTYKNLSTEVMGSTRFAEGTLFTDHVGFGGAGSRADQRMVKINASAPFAALSVESQSTAAIGLGFPPTVTPPLSFPGQTRLEYSMQGENRPLWKYLADEVWAEPVFGLYLQKQKMYDDIAWNAVPNAGQVMFGGLNKNMYTGEVNYVPTIGEQWAINLDGVKVAGQAIDVSVNGTAAPLPMEMDSYNWNVALIPEVAARVHAAVPGAVPATGLTSHDINTMGPPEFNLTRVPCNTTTNITLTFGGVDYDIEPVHWVAKMEEDKCLSRIVGFRRNILGTPFLLSVYTAFRANPLSVGFAAIAPMAADYIQFNESYGSTPGDKGGAAIMGNAVSSRPSLVALLASAAVAVASLL